MTKFNVIAVLLVFIGLVVLPILNTGFLVMWVMEASTTLCIAGALLYLYGQHYELKKRVAQIEQRDPRSRNRGQE